MGNKLVYHAQSYRGNKLITLKQIHTRMELVKFNKSNRTHTYHISTSDRWLIEIEDKRFSCNPKFGKPGQYDLEITAEDDASSYESIMYLTGSNGRVSLARLIYTPIVLMPPNQPH